MAEFTSYTRHDWVDGEYITDKLLDNIEEGIENISNFIGNGTINYNDLITAINNLGSMTSDISSSLESITNDINTIEATMENLDVDTLITQTQQSINTALSDVLPQLSSAVNAATAAKEAAENAVTSATLVATEAANLAIANQLGSVQEVLGIDYYDDDWILSNDSISERLNDLENKTVDFTDIEKTLGVKINNTLTAPASAQNASLYDMINDLSSGLDSIEDSLGLNGSQSGSLTLIEKIEAALGRSLDITSGEEINNGYYSESLKSLIQEIQGVLGIEGGVSGGQSNLLDSINDISSMIYGDIDPTHFDKVYTLAKVLDDLYGELSLSSSNEYIRDDNPLIDSLKSLPSSFNTLTTKVEGIEIDNQDIRASLNDISSWEDIVHTAYKDADILNIDDGNYSGKYLWLKRKDKDAPTTWQGIQADIDNTYLKLPEGGGGAIADGGTAIITRITDSSIQVLTGKTCNIEYKLEARYNDNSLTGNGTAVWYVGGVQVATDTALNIALNAPTRTNIFDISPYLSIGTNNVILQVSVDTGGSTPTIARRTWAINVINFSLTWNYNETSIFNNTLTLEWVPYGAGINKTTYIKLDNGSPIAISSTMQSGITQVYTFEHNLVHGVHTCEMYMSATINGVLETTDSQYHDIIIVESTNNTPVISASFYVDEVEQYDTIAIPIVVYTPNSSTTDEVILADGETIVDTWTNVDRTLHYWNYSAVSTGSRTLTISVGNITKTITFTVTAINISNKEIIGYDFKLKASEFVSNEALQANELLNFSNNFDWINGGIKSEKDANNNIQQYICVKAGTTMTINKKLFNSELTTGLNFKVIMKATNCIDYDAKILECYANDIGIQLFAHKGILKSSGRTITTQYSENTYIELEFEVYGTNDTPRYMMCWVDGVLSCARVCDNTDHFEQTNKANIIIGSTNCDINIYLIKNYYTKLNRNEHIVNFIADAPNATIMKARYNRNNILGEDNEINYEKLYEAAPDCRIWLYDISRMTTGKKDKVKVYNFQQLWKNGGKEYHDGLHATNAELTVQGTSSVNYRKGAANTDINFGIAGCTLLSANNENLLSDDLEYKGMKINNTSIPITYSNMKVNFASCEQVNNMCNAMWYQNFQPYPSLSSRDCMEFAMGVQFIHDRGENEPTVKDPTTGENMLEVALFSDKVKYDPTKYYMYSIGNLGTSKKNTAIFHSENECCIEVTDNTTNGQRMIAWPAGGVDWAGSDDNGDHSYEMRYPETKTPNQMITDGWERFVKWMASNNPNAATNEVLAEAETYPIYTFKGHHREGTQVLRGTTVSQYAGTYTHDTFNRRMAKMLSECEDYMAMDSVVYHFCFIERHTMMDNVAKNTFWSANKTNQYINGIEQNNTLGYWIWDLSKNYDNDTSDGNNNEGQMVFDYGNEANDSISGKKVFNASESVWFVFISNLKEACATMFINRESATSNDGQLVGAWNSLSYHNFLLNEQQKIPERVWNECYWYDYLRTYEKNIDTSWISFLDGGQKIQQRKHFETFQELYFASKYMSPLSIGNNITLRGYTPRITEDLTEEEAAIITTSLEAVPSKSEVTITMYNKCYLTVHMGNVFKQIKVAKKVPATLTFTEEVVKIINGEEQTITQYLTLDDTVINIDTASMIQEIDDLSPLYPGQCSFSAAYRLRSIKIGSAIEGYQNLNISETETGAFDFSNNTLLERLEIQNLKAINAPLNLEGCQALKYLDASGSSFTGYSFADGGLAENIHLGSPIIISMKNLLHLQDNNFIIDSTDNLQYLIVDNCPNVDSFSRTLLLNNLLSLNLLNVNWHITGASFKTFIAKLNTIPAHVITGHIELINPMGTFTSNDFGNLFTKDVRFFYEDAQDNNIIKPYYIISFYDNMGNFLETNYTRQGQPIIDPSNKYFTEEYITQYNIDNNVGWQDGDVNRIGFSGWRISTENTEYDLSSASSDIDLYAMTVTQARLNYNTLTTDSTVINTIYKYYTINKTITSFYNEDSSFVRDHYLYEHNTNYWTTNGTNYLTTAPESTTNRPAIYTLTKANALENLYRVYTKTAATYTINIYNTNINSETGDLLGTITNKTAIANSDDDYSLIKRHQVQLSELNSWNPTIDNSIHIEGYSNDANKTDENRVYRFLGWSPYIDADTPLNVTGDMNIYLKYYKIDDVFTNYFLNKLIKCDLSDSGITKLPNGAFLHNSNLTRIVTKATNLGSYVFCNQNPNVVKNYIFSEPTADIIIGPYTFYGLYNANIFFKTSGTIYVDSNAFANMQYCNILIPYSNKLIQIIDDGNSANNRTRVGSAFANFIGEQLYHNAMYVSDAAYNSPHTNREPSELIKTGATETIHNGSSGYESQISACINQAEVSSSDYSFI